MKNLFTIDFGNTHPHFALYENGKLQSVSPLTNSDRLSSRQYKVIASQVASTSFTEQVKKNVEDRMINVDSYWNYTDHTFAEMKVNYAPTLGQDRLVQGAHAFHLFPQQSTLVIDAGTFVTIDLVNKDGLAGGYILPGLQLLLEDYLAGDQLKKYSKEEIIGEAILTDHQWPNDTKKASCRGIIELYQSFYRNILTNEKIEQIVVTGGDCGLHLQMLKDYEKISHRPHFIHESLYFLANFKTNS